ncbi:MAG: HAMP domain-containing histidine kinase [Clostridia bacterium]|nr:HAMP domain-containing histidine kinase [Clostridia bacterium]
MKRIRIDKIKIDREKSRSQFSLTLIFAVLIFVVLLAAIAFATALVYLFSEIDLISGLNDELSLGTILICMIGFSIFFGATFSLLLAQIPLKPMNRFVRHMNALASGNFKARLRFRGTLSEHKLIKEIEQSVNKLAEELEKTEMLRSDFINNFSHEFKTPIVSIAGLARLLNQSDVSDEDRRRYLSAIEDESRRLATMATNILNLTKVESQSILTGVTEFNLSEQIRSSVLLFENKWERKELELSLDFDEHMINANEELLKEVWINLIDNAIKFSPKGGTLAISVTESKSCYGITVANTADEIPAEAKDSLFKKFYQVDKSHASEGNGIGLAIVSKIVELHKGTIEVGYSDGLVTFTVTLPRNL